MLRVCKIHFLARIERHHRPWCQLDTPLVLGVYELVGRQHFAYRFSVLHGCGSHKHREHSADNRRRDFGIGVPPQLFQRLQDWGQNGDTPPLACPLAVHNMEDVPPPAVPIGFYPQLCFFWGGGVI